MNTGHFSLRDLKRMCRTAMDELISKHGYRRNQFGPADGDEAISAPPMLQKRFIEHGFMKQIAVGTMILPGTVDYWGEVGDDALPIKVLRECEFWSGPEAEKMLAAMAMETFEDQGYGKENERG